MAGELELAAFEQRLRDWAARADQAAPDLVSIETPVFKGAWLMPCIESVLGQTSSSWTFSARWDGGDALSRQVLEIVAALNHPKLNVYFGENRGIAHTRRFLTELGRGQYILTLDDDDILAPQAVEKFLACAHARPCSGIVRAMREFIDENGEPAGSDTWFPFMPRQYQFGMVTDPYNHSQPALIRRTAYDRTSGWEGFEEFRSAGEDCDMFLKIEEVAPIELLPEVLYYYRLSDRRTSLVITNDAAFEMWRRLVDKSIARIGLPLKRATDRPPFAYERLPRPPLNTDMVDVQTCATARPLSAANERLRQSRHPLACLVDDDVELPPGTLATLCDVMHEHDADIIAPRMITRQGTIVCGDPYLDAQGRPVRRGDGEPDRGQYNQIVEVPCLLPGALLVRREVLRAVGGVDERYRDRSIAVADLCLMARRRDFRCVYAGSAAVVVPPRREDPPLEADRDWFERKWAASSALL